MKYRAYLTSFVCRSFRLQSERPLKELMIDDHGCSQDQPGIGNIAYVKDIQTETIVSTQYRCSIFGKYQHPLTGFGWVSMKYCTFCFWEITKFFNKAVVLE